MQRAVIRAGHEARQILADEGLRPEAVRIIAGAAGGPKWLALGRLDRFLFGEWLRGRSEPLALIGSSIGAYRFACAAQDDPVAAIDRFEQAYLAQRYSARPGPQEVSAQARAIIDAMLGAHGARQVMSHPGLRLSIVTARALRRSASDAPAQLRMGLASATLDNALGRERLGRHFQRVVFSDPRQPLAHVDFGDAFGTVTADLSPDSLAQVIEASGSIPMLMQGVSEIAGAPPGVYRDGGLVDYHMDLAYDLDDGVALMPHFSTRMVTGWLDKFLPWRKPDPRRLARLVLIAPSDDFLATWPGGGVPNRKDFQKYGGDYAALTAAWRRAIELSGDFAAEVAELLARDRLPQVGPLR